MRLFVALKWNGGASLSVYLKKLLRSVPITRRNTVFLFAAVATVVFAFANIGGGTYTFLEKRPTVIVIDDVGNAYQIDCAETDWFLERIKPLFRKR